MSQLFDRLDEVQNRVETLSKALSKQDEEFLSKNIRTKLVDQLVQDTLGEKPVVILLHDVLRNGCVGFFCFKDLELTGILRDDIVQRGISDDDMCCPTVTEDIIEFLEMREKQLMED
jgi:hypothetical protein